MLYLLLTGKDPTKEPLMAKRRVMLQMPYTPGIASVFDNHPGWLSNTEAMPGV